MTAGQQAMAVAMIYPKPEKGGRGKRSQIRESLTKAQENRLSQARTETGLRAMAVAMIYPEPKPGRGKKKPSEAEGIPEGRLSMAPTVLKFVPPEAAGCQAGWGL